MTSKKVILVTGGTGLVGSAIKYVIETEPQNSRFGKHDDEEWIFARSSEGDLRHAIMIDRLDVELRPTNTI